MTPHRHALLPPLLLLLLAAAPLAAAAQPHARWLDTAHSFGTFDEADGPVTTLFRVVNDGDAPLSLLAVRATCGCTTPTYSRQPIAPGDTGQVAVTYHPAGRPGRFRKSVRVTTNATPADTALTISGLVRADDATLRSRFPIEVGPMRLKTSVVQFGEMAKGRTRTAFLDGYNQGTDTLRPRLPNLPRYIIADVTPTAVAPGEQLTFTLFFDSSKASDLWGLTLTDIAVAADSAPDAPTATVTLAAIVNESFDGLTADEREKAPQTAFSTATLDLGRVARGATATATLAISNYGRSPLLLRRIYSTDSFITLRCRKQKVAPGATVEVEVSVDTSAMPPDAPLVNSRLTVIANDPRRPSTPIRIVAEILD